MKRILLLAIIALITFALFALYKNPEILEKIWLWLVGLAGAFIKLGRDLIAYFKGMFDENKDKEELKKTKSIPKMSDVEIKLLRYSDDGETTVGLLYIDNQFYCYTLEDAFHEEKIPGETRIPAGNYQIKFNKQETPLTLKYRERYPEWFTNHIEILNVPQFTSIYIHNGGDHTHTEGCILVSDSLSIGDQKTFLTNSRNTFQRLYGFLSQKLENQQTITIKIQDEDWSKKLAS